MLDNLFSVMGAYPFTFGMVIGLIVGSFLNVVIYRLPIGMSLNKPGSHCFNCKKPVAYYDNVPVISYLVLRGKCRHCQATFSIRYAAVELLTGLLTGMGCLILYDDPVLMMLFWLGLWTFMTASLIAYDNKSR